MTPLVLILMGSESDYDQMREAASVLHEFNIPFEFTVSSAHRSPERTATIAREAAARGIKVIIAGAGMAAHLAGVLAAESELPVLGVPLNAGPMGGFDSLLSTAQMPGGVPVAALGVGKSGAKNAGMMAVRILALSDQDLATRHRQSRKKMASGVADAAERVMQRAQEEFGRKS